MSSQPTDDRDPTETEIGGYFGLDLPSYPVLHPDALRYQSGRAAIRAVIEAGGFDRVMLPAYVCNSVINAVEDSGAIVETYSLDSALYPSVPPDSLPERCALLYVNYFGLCDASVSRLTKDFPANRLIIDNSQALFSPHERVLATVYSPRKFAGVPDGGLLVASPKLNITLPKVEDSASVERMRALLVRMAYSGRDGYADFQKIALSLKDTTPLAMSRLTRRLFRSIDWRLVSERRRANFQVVAKKLDAINVMRWACGEQSVPMCYPLTLRGLEIEKLRAELFSRNIYVPTYWLDALPRIATTSTEHLLVTKTLFVPIDQRMKATQAESVADTILELIERN